MTKTCRKHRSSKSKNIEQSSMTVEAASIDFFFPWVGGGGGGVKMFFFSGGGGGGGELSSNDGDGYENVT